MKLRFIGIDGSMGLRHGNIYKVSLSSNDKYIIAFIERNYLNGFSCPYGSPQAFAKNWEVA